MKQLLLLIPFAMLITACNPLVKIHVSYHVPYCGGKLPNESEAQGEILPMANHGYIVQESLLHPAKEKIIYTDSAGNWTGKLSRNTRFILVDIEKTLDDVTLKRTHPLQDSILYTYLTEKEIMKWRLENDGVFSVEKTQKEVVRFLIERPCFVGSNPIIRYQGPRPR